MAIAATYNKRPYSFESTTKGRDAKKLHIHSVVEPIEKTFTIPTCILTNEFGIKSFVIGTCHVVDKESFQNPFFQKILGKCSVLYSEGGSYIFNSYPFGTQRNEEPQYQHDRFRYPLDVRITEIAEERKLPIFALDEGIPKLDEDTLTMCADRLELGAEKMEDLYRRNWETITLSPNYPKLIESWKAADIPFLKQIRKNTPKEYLLREGHWVKKLIPKLRKARKPIAIVVGAAHLVGRHSLSERLKRAGLKVELLTNSSQI